MHSDYDYDVCIVGLKCLDYLTGTIPHRYLGGIESQLSALAFGFAERGLRVAFVTYQHEHTTKIHVNGVDIFPSYAPEAGLPIVRFVYPRAYGLWRALRRIRSRTYMQMGAGVETGITSFARRFLKRPSRFVYFIASDSDCRIDPPFINVAREKVVYRYGLRSASLIVAQTESQAALLHAEYGLGSVVERMPALPPQPVAESIAEGVASLTAAGRHDVLWVGRFQEAKRVEWLYDIARAMPDIQFHVAGAANADSEYAQKVHAEGDALKNVTLHGKLNSEALGVLYRGSAVLCCTSRLEGFPTVFLEAWANGMPVVTTFDPDGVVEKHELGRHCDSVPELVDAITTARASARGLEWSENGRAFFTAKYSMAACLPRLLPLLQPSEPLSESELRN